MGLLIDMRRSCLLKSIETALPYWTVLMPPPGSDFADRDQVGRSDPAGQDQDFERFSDYLILLARAAIGRTYQAKLAPSDVVRRTLNEAYDARDQFRGTTEAELRAWLRQALKNNLRDEIRRLKAAKRDVSREVSIDQAVEESNSRLELPARDHTPDEEVERAEEVLRLVDAIIRLPEAQRAVIELYHLGGQPIAEVAASIGRTEAAVGGLLHRAFKKLRRELGG